MLLSIITLSYSNQVIGQEKVNVSAGIGILDLINIGVLFQGNQNQLGFSFGSMPDKDGSEISIAGDVYYHFGGSSELSDRHPWFARFGMLYIRTESTTYIDKYVFLNLRIGRDFNLSNKVGIGLDAGPMIQLFKLESEKKPSSNWDFPIFPGLGIKLFYRI